MTGGITRDSAAHIFQRFWSRRSNLLQMHLKMQKMLDVLDDLDDVQDVYHNGILPEDEE